VMLNVFVGYDDREDEAYRVCHFSIANRTPETVAIRPLKHRPLRQLGLFTRPWRITESGQYVDERDGKPFSTQFSHSRFLVPAYARHLGVTEKWALFCDCDFMFRADLRELFALADDRFAVMCVKHRHKPAEGLKMDGMAQTQYRRKNWSSLVLFNLHHPANAALDAKTVNEQPGSWLHAFGWLRDKQIGEFPPEWNWIEGASPEIEPKAVHFSAGGPWFPEYADVRYADEWRMVRAQMHNPRPTVQLRMMA
jgi:hypothetical protein